MSPAVRDLRSKRAFLKEVRRGLARSPKELPSKYLYDERGSRLFEEICALDEYYPTRTERAIMETHAPRMASRIGPGCCLIEYGSGSSLKTRLLLDELTEPAAYVPVDISPKHLGRAAAEISRAYPDLEVLPVCADFTSAFSLPACRRPVRRRVVYFPGSTIGNFHPPEADRLLGRIAALCGPGGGLVIGLDLQKDPEIVEAAYNDARGVTAAFNLNILTHLNRELSTDFRADRFRHRAFYDPAAGRVEMHLVSLDDQAVRLDGEVIRVRRGESIRTECSYKYRVDRFAETAAGAGLRLDEAWTDPHAYFAVLYLTVA